MADIFAKEGIRIVVSGTDSLGFLFAGDNELYDRTVWVNTTYVPFAEHSRVLEVNDVDDYVRYGGLMKKGIDGERIVFDYESTCRYLDSSVVNNIVSSIKKSPYDSPLDALSKEELKTIIEKIVELYSGVISVKQLVNQLNNVSVNYPVKKLVDLVDRSVIDNLMLQKKNITSDFASVVGADTIIEHSVTESVLKYLESILRSMNLLSVTSVSKFSRTDGVWYCDEDWEYYVIQPAIKYYHLEKAKEFINSRDYYRQLTLNEKNFMKQKLEEKILGDVLEQIIVYDCTKTLSSGYTVTKPVFYENGLRKGEYDMLIWDKHSNIHWEFEIKHSKICDYNQVKHLRSSTWEEVVARNFGECVCKCVLYRGKSCSDSNTGIVYVNITDFLIKLSQCGSVQNTIDLLKDNFSMNLF